MVYNEKTAERTRNLLEGKVSFSEKKMFGGLTFMINGNMAVGVMKDDLMVRVGPLKYKEYLQKTNAREMDFTGRPMKGMVFVPLKTINSDLVFQEWVNAGISYTLSLTPK
ncbi:MAG: TfoX/Sxy family protein [Candidatus Kariarchaeaceae archaeon]|jgi:TfoX/Sxy family transcriptional regulator of competence genes